MSIATANHNEISKSGHLAELAAVAAAKVPRLAMGKGWKGPEFYGCFNTGLAPAIFHSRTGKYAVGPEIPCRDAMANGGLLSDRRIHDMGGKGDARRRVYVFKSRGPAVRKFAELAAAAALANENIAAEHRADAAAARKGDMAAALRLGDY